MIDALMKWLEQAQTALATDDHATAIAAFQQVQSLLPTDVSIAIALANSHRLNGDAASAVKTLLSTFGHGNWTDPKVAFALGSALLDAGQPREAADCIARTVQAFPNDAAAHGAYAGALRASAKPDLAWHHAQRALSLAPQNPTFLLTAAQVRHDLRDAKAALAFLDKADRVRPNHAPTRLQRAFSTLISGVNAEGWAHYEARPLPKPATQAKDWHGEPLHGDSVLVTAEQGVGDQFQFSRFISELHQRGARRVVVECHANIVSLFTNSGFEAIARGTNIETDWHVPMMSLPHRLKTGSDTYGRKIPYLTAPLGATVSAPPQMQDGPEGRTGLRRLGLVWAGNPEFLGRASRDLDPNVLSAIVAIPGIEWVSLQYGEAASMTPDSMTRGHLTASWADSATLLQSLDGLVTVDTGIAHLAGALAVPTWVLVAYVSDWRWGASGSVSQWYPSTRVIRQSLPGAWDTAVKELAADLSQPMD